MKKSLSERWPVEPDSLDVLDLANDGAPHEKQSVLGEDRLHRIDGGIDRRQHRSLSIGGREVGHALAVLHELITVDVVDDRRGGGVRGNRFEELQALLEIMESGPATNSVEALARSGGLRGIEPVMPIN